MASSAADLSSMEFRAKSVARASTLMSFESMLRGYSESVQQAKAPNGGVRHD